MSSDSQNVNQNMVFYGKDGIEAEEFIRSVMMAAKAAGKLRDNSWIVDEVSVAFAGDALRWYIELDDETRNDWLLLRRAIIQKYPPPSQRSWHGSGPSTPSQPLTVPTPATAAHFPSSFASMNASQKYFYIQAVLQDTGGLLYIGVKNGDVVLVTSRSEGVRVRLDSQTKELRAIQMPGLTFTGEKFEIRYSFGSYWGWGYNVNSAIVQLLDSKSLPKGTDPTKGGKSITSWNVTDENVLQAIPPNTSRYSIRLYLTPDADENQYPHIRAYMEDPAGQVASSLRFLTLKLEEI
ncbi:hypothetical protein M407DRAFT_17340 [Tulasnella calospora MUT 4182]|uniref:Uncharacterized protein n=1 Tax=Tulasnella calospora MUT 4182 TaxID=1051891 RepID=A0A0C3QLQ1_9AGAM|nr:hypothetical protein M407DRAFT_17340 [Tulasnella calospora MUT 4182]